MLAKLVSEAMVCFVLFFCYRQTQRNIESKGNLFCIHFIVVASGQQWYLKWKGRSTLVSKEILWEGRVKAENIDKQCRIHCEVDRFGIVLLVQ